MISEQEQYDSENQIPLAKSNLRLALMVLYRDLDYLAEELVKAVGTLDALDGLICRLQSKYEEIRKVSPKIWDGWKDEPHEE